jgi:hypothetical protein
MNNAISGHISKLVGEVKSIIGYLQTQLDIYYEKIQNSSFHLHCNKIIPIIRWQQKTKSADTLSTKREAQILWFNKSKKTK